MSTITDTFQRADAASLGTTSDGTATWTARQGTGWTIRNQIAFTVSAPSIVTVDGAQTTKVVRGTWLNAFNTNDTAFVTRYQDNSNFFMAYNGGGTGSKWGIAKCTAGSFSFPYASTVVPLEGDIVELSVTPTAITLRVNGVQLGTVTDSAYSASTPDGLWSGSSGSAVAKFETGSLTLQTPITTMPRNSPAGASVAVSIPAAGSAAGFTPVYPYSPPITGQQWPRPY